MAGKMLVLKKVHLSATGEVCVIASQKVMIIES